MEIVAKAGNIRMSARKVRLVVDSVKKKPLSQALVDLKFIQKRATKPILKVLNSAVANAKHNFGVELGNLVIKKIEVGEGSTYKRFRAVSRGRAHHILKRTSNIKVVLETEKVEVKPKKVLKKTVTSAEPKIEPVEHREEMKEFPFKENEMIFEEPKLKKEKAISKRPVLTRRIPQGKGK